MTCRRVTVFGWPGSCVAADAKPYDDPSCNPLHHEDRSRDRHGCRTAFYPMSQRLSLSSSLYRFFAHAKSIRWRKAVQLDQERRAILGRSVLAFSPMGLLTGCGGGKAAEAPQLPALVLSLSGDAEPSEAAVTPSAPSPAPAPMSAS